MTRTRPRSRRDAQASSARNRWVRVRIYAATATLTVLFFAIAYKAYGVQIDEGDHYQRVAQRQHLRRFEIPAPRGVIYDVKGRELAVTANVDSVFANPRRVVDATGTAESLADILGLDIATLTHKLSTRRHFIWIKRRIDPHKADLIRDLDLPGVELTPEPRRFYPSQKLAGTVIGFAGVDGEGLEGIELTMDELLSGRRSSMEAVRDARGRVMLAEAANDAEPGASITLTIDRRLQHVAERTLADTVAEHQAKAGTILILDVKSSEVMAMANWPTCDPNSPAAGIRANARNHAVSDAYEIGSVMKVFTIAAALDAGAVYPSQVIDVEHGRFRIGRKVIKDSHRDWELDVGGIVKRSSNVGAVKVARKLGAEPLRRALLRYGFGARTGIELPGERAGILRPTKRWGAIGLATISFGYGMTATPVQVAAAVAAIGNDGVYREPRVIRHVDTAGGERLYDRNGDGRRIMKPRTARQMRRMMASVFDKGKKGGTARTVDVIGYHTGGKTGTAQKLDPKTRLYSEHLYLSSFVGLAPIEDPRIVVLVVIDEPGGKQHYGAQVAGPAFARVVSDSLRYLGVPPSKPDPPAASRVKGVRAREPAGDADEPGEPGVEVLSEAVAADLGSGRFTIPDFGGLGLARALDLARASGIAVKIEGTGRAIDQDPAAGARAESANCTIVFGADRR